MAQIVPGNRGGKILLHQGYRYQCNRKRALHIYWRCDVANCPAKITTNFFNVLNPNPVINVVHPPGPHNHAAPVNSIERSDVIQRMRDEVRRDPSRMIVEVYNDVVVQAGQQVYSF